MTEEEFEEYLNNVENNVFVLGFEFPAGTALRTLDPKAFKDVYLEYISVEDSGESAQE